MMGRQTRNWALKLSTLLVVTACFVVMGATLLISQNFKNILTLWGENVQLTIYLDPTISSAGTEQLKEKLRQTGKVSDVEFVDQERALKDFRTQLASYAPDLSQDNELLQLIPSSLQVRLNPNISSEDQSKALQEIAEQFRGQEGIDEISYGQEWVKKYSALVSTIERSFQFLGIIVLLASLFVISNAMRASIHSRHDEIVVLEMIGATATMIRRPFLREGALLGFASSAISLAICFLLYTGVRELVLAKLNFLQLSEHLTFLSILFCLAFVAMGTMIGTLASYLCVRRLNDGYAGLQRS